MTTQRIKPISINLFRPTFICAELEHPNGKPTIVIDPNLASLSLSREELEFWQAEQDNLNKGINKRIALGVLSNYCAEDLDKYAEADVVYKGRTYRFRLWEIIFSDK
jgi:hypothetical protein